MYRLLDEVSLLRASLQGETEAWGEIVARYKDAVFGLCLGFLHNPADAEDITHDAFIRAYENLRRYKLDKKFSTWIFTVASNLCRNRLRHRRYHPVIPPPDEIAGGSDPAVEYERDVRLGQVRKALDQLPYLYRTPLVLRFYNELPYNEIAEILSVPEGTVKTRIHRAKIQLRKIMEKDGLTDHEQR